MRAPERLEEEQNLPWNFAEYRAALEKVKQTPAYVELEKRIVDKFPPTYKELDSRLDRARLLSIDFLPLAQAKARALAIEMGVSVNFEIADVHRWNYPEAEFDVVVEIFTQSSSPNERRAKWTGMRQS